MKIVLMLTFILMSFSSHAVLCTQSNFKKTMKLRHKAFLQFQKIDREISDYCKQTREARDMTDIDACLLHQELELEFSQHLNPLIEDYREITSEVFERWFLLNGSCRGANARNAQRSHTLFRQEDERWRKSLVKDMNKCLKKLRSYQENNCTVFE